MWSSVEKFEGNEVEVAAKVGCTEEVRLMVARDAGSREAVQVLFTCTSTQGKAQVVKGRFVVDDTTRHVALVVPVCNAEHVLRLGRMALAVAKTHPEAEGSGRATPPRRAAAGRVALAAKHGGEEA